jgi:hypothetical protein
MRITPCAIAKKSLRKEGITATECNCCGFWEMRRMTDAHGNLSNYAVNPDNGKAVRL